MTSANPGPGGDGGVKWEGERGPDMNEGLISPALGTGFYKPELSPQASLLVLGDGRWDTRVRLAQKTKHRASF